MKEIIFAVLKIIIGILIPVVILPFVNKSFSNTTIQSEPFKYVMMFILVMIATFLIFSGLNYIFKPKDKK